MSYREQIEFNMYFSIIQENSEIYLTHNLLENTLIYQRLDYSNFDLMDIYQLTHEIMYLTGLGRWKHNILVSNSEYLNYTIKKLLARMIDKNNVDLIAELILVSQLLDINLDYKDVNNSLKLLHKFIKESVKFELKNEKDFLSIYHTILVISLLEG